MIVWEWDLQNAEYDEEPRPEFETSVKTFRINPVTREREPYLPAWSKAIRSLATGSIVFFMVTINNSCFTATRYNIHDCSFVHLDMRSSRRGSGNHHISHLAGGRVLRRRWSLLEETREDIHFYDGRSYQLGDNHDTHADISSNGTVDGQHGESKDADRVRIQLHVQDLLIRIRQLLLVPDLHRLFQGN